MKWLGRPGDSTADMSKLWPSLYNFPLSDFRMDMLSVFFFLSLKLSWRGVLYRINTVKIQCLDRDLRVTKYLRVLIRRAGAGCSRE